MQIRQTKIWLSLASAVIFGASAVSGIASGLNLSIPFLPSFLGSELALKIFLLLAGILLLYDSFSVRNINGHMKISAIIAGLILAFLGAFPLLNQMGLLDFLPIIPTLSLSPVVFAALLLFYSLYLLWDVYLLLRSRV